jgi:hypothetical protein
MLVLASSCLWFYFVTTHPWAPMLCVFMSECHERQEHQMSSGNGSVSATEAASWQNSRESWRRGRSQSLICVVNVDVLLGEFVDDHDDEPIICV